MQALIFGKTGQQLLTATDDLGFVGQRRSGNDFRHCIHSHFGTNETLIKFINCKKLASSPRPILR